MLRWLVLACIVLLSMYPTISRFKVLDDCRYSGRNQMRMIHSDMMRRLYERMYHVGSPANSASSGNGDELASHALRNGFLVESDQAKRQSGKDITAKPRDHLQLSSIVSTEVASTVKPSENIHDVSVDIESTPDADRARKAREKVDANLPEKFAMDRSLPDEDESPTSLPDEGQTHLKVETEEVLSKATSVGGANPGVQSPEELSTDEFLYNDYDEIWDGQIEQDARTSLNESETTELNSLEDEALEWASHETREVLNAVTESIQHKEVPDRSLEETENDLVVDGDEGSFDGETTPFEGDSINHEMYDPSTEDAASFLTSQQSDEGQTKASSTAESPSQSDEGPTKASSTSESAPKLDSDETNAGAPVDAALSDGRLESTAQHAFVAPVEITDGDLSNGSLSDSTEDGPGHFDTVRADPIDQDIVESEVLIYPFDLISTDVPGESHSPVNVASDVTDSLKDVRMPSDHKGSTNGTISQGTKEKAEIAIGGVEDMQDEESRPPGSIEDKQEESHFPGPSGAKFRTDSDVDDSAIDGTEAEDAALDEDSEKDDATDRWYHRSKEEESDVIDFDTLDERDAPSHSRSPAPEEFNGGLLDAAAKTTNETLIKGEKSGSNDELNESLPKKSPPKEGSLASFFQKVSEREKSRLKTESARQVTEEGLTKAFSTPVDDVESASVISEVKQTTERSETFATTPSDNDHGSDFHGTWGVKRHEDAPVKSEPQSPKRIASFDDESENYQAMAEEIYGSAFGHDAKEIDVPETDLVSRSKSVNAEFVEGLDDIDKFLEKVEPPDELDVGAAGSSIQDVLIGQGAQIVMKRIAIGLRRVRQHINGRLSTFLSRHRNPEGDFALVTREQVQTSAIKVRISCLRAFDEARDLIGDFFGFGDDFDDDDFAFGQQAFELESLRQRLAPQRSINAGSGPSNEDLESFIRQRSRK